jgi:hypothetical protein
MIMERLTQRTSFVRFMGVAPAAGIGATARKEPVLTASSVKSAKAAAERADHRKSDFSHLIRPTGAGAAAFQKWQQQYRFAPATEAEPNFH